MDGTVKKVKVKEWSRDDQANNIRVTTPDGTSYYSGSENIMLINEKNEATTQNLLNQVKAQRIIRKEVYKKWQKKNYEAVYSASLSREMEADRYIVIDNESGEILDTASGWGYDSKDNAYRAFEYKLRHGEKDMRPAPTDEETTRKEYEAAREFYNKHRDIQEALVNADAFDDTYTKYDEDGGFTISIHDMTNKKRDRFSPEVVDRILASMGTLI